MKYRYEVLWLWVAAAVVALALSGRLASYVHPAWRPVMVVVGALIMALCISSMCSGGRTATSGPGRVAWLLLVPVLVLTLAAPPPLGSAMLRATTSGLQSTRVHAVGRTHMEFAQLSSTAPNPLTVEELNQRFFFAPPGSLEGKVVEVEGFISHLQAPHPSGSAGGTADAAGTDTAPGQPTLYLNRFKIYCCAADAIAYTVGLSTAADFPDDTWVKAQGVVVSAPPSPDGSAAPTPDGSAAPTPVLLVSAITAIAKPEEPYL